MSVTICFASASPDEPARAPTNHEPIRRRRPADPLSALLGMAVNLLQGTARPVGSAVGVKASVATGRASVPARKRVDPQLMRLMGESLDRECR